MHIKGGRVTVLRLQTFATHHEDPADCSVWKSCWVGWFSLSTARARRLELLGDLSYMVWIICNTCTFRVATHPVFLLAIYLPSVCPSHPFDRYASYHGDAHHLFVIFLSTAVYAHSLCCVDISHDLILNVVGIIET